MLRELELDVIEMPSDEELPESVFVEDTAVVCNNIALLTKPGNATRLKEVRRMRNYARLRACLPGNGNSYSHGQT